ncbi:MAG: acyl-CoA thioesterase [Phycisphaerales bacterium]|jgi:acyl-CoA thioester hydrolase|nr:acyl-CoA thioesterase [Phycisphaerales bacterium]MBT7171277.1 acyl-CoA thioesterase [Phycisphaerales bacterium]
MTDCPNVPVATLRVRYSEIDQMGTFYNSRALEWFEVGRTEWLRGTGMAYTDMESRGVMLPLVESHVNYRSRARYDDELAIFVTASMQGRARMEFAVTITQAATGEVVCEGTTVHAIVAPGGKVIRPPAWFLDLVQTGNEQ